MYENSLIKYYSLRLRQTGCSKFDNIVITVSKDIKEIYNKCQKLTAFGITDSPTPKKFITTFNITDTTNHNKFMTQCIIIIVAGEYIFSDIYGKTIWGNQDFSKEEFEDIIKKIHRLQRNYIQKKLDVKDEYSQAKIMQIIMDKMISIYRVSMDMI